MKTIKGFTNIYASKIAPLDLELLISAATQKPREFVLAHPEYKIPVTRSPKLEAWIKRRIKHAPIAYILGQKEFYGLSFKVNKYTLIPRPETELLVEKVLEINSQNKTIIDIGTGSGNIVISLAKNLRGNNKFIAIDISGKALVVAKQNANLHGVSKQIRFLRGNLLEPMLKIKNYELKNKETVIVANLPYLSKNVYASASQDIKKYEPRLALLSGKDGLQHYGKLLKQIDILRQRDPLLHVSCFMEIGPEQKRLLQKLLIRFFPKAKVSFYKDLSGRWRICQFDL